MKWWWMIGCCSVFLAGCGEVKTEKKEATVPHDSIVPAPVLSKEQTEKAYRLDTLFTQLFSRNEFNGNVLIAEGGTVLLKKSYGTANTQTQQALSDSSLFQLASVSKTITACLTLQLVKEGKIVLQNDVRKYLPDFPYEGIQVSHLLNHRSGLFNYIYFCAAKDSAAPQALKNLSNSEVYQMICKEVPPPYLKADVHFNYCNTNYMLLALIAEKVSGRSFKELVKEKIFKKCSMQHTLFADELQNKPSLAKGYTFSWREVEGDRFDQVWGDKGIYTTTGDLFLFEEAYFTGKLIPQNYIDTALIPYSSERKLGNYGYGWRMKNFDAKNKDNNKEKIVYHNGWWHGYRTALQRRLKDNVTVIILSNRLNRSVYETWRVFNAIDGEVLIPAAEEKEE
jgi:CubicO group peptidase (beta-lactamase class C family)